MPTHAYLDLLARDPGVRGYTCRAPRALVTVGSDGAVRDCLRADVPLAQVRDLRARGARLSEIFELPRRRELVSQAASCAKCNNADIVELSWLWDLRPAMLGKAVRLARL
jgi:hypothetical protein